MKKLLIFLIFLIINSFVFAQIEEEILNYESNKTTLITKGRKMLFDKFLEKDLNTVRRVSFYMMNELADSNYIALYPSEYWMLLYWTQDYMELAGSLEYADKTEIALTLNLQRIHPSMDFLFERLKSETYKAKQELIFQIQNADLDNEVKDFLILYLEDLTAGSNHFDAKQDTINQMASKYIEIYPNSVYNPSLRENISFVYEPANFGFSIEFFTGVGFFTETLKETYTNPFVWGVAFDIYYKNFELYLRDYLAYNKTKIDIPYSSSVYYAGLSTSMVIPEASLGYKIYESKRMKFSPFVGIASTEIGPPASKTKNNEDLREVTMTFTTTYVLGFNVDLKLGKDNNSKSYPRTSFGFFRLRYNYNMPQFSKHYDEMTGNYHSITIGFGGVLRGVDRIN